MERIGRVKTFQRDGAEKMAIFVTGDIHGDPSRLSTDNFCEQKSFSGNKNENIVIILGDFGLVESTIGE